MSINIQEMTNFSLSTEIESDMRIYPISQPKDKLTDFLERIVKTKPLLGMAVISEKNFKVVEEQALKAIKHLCANTDVKDIGHLAIFMSIIQYAKKWERSENSKFWEYICEQLGYKYSDSLYSILTNSVKKSCESYQRFFITGSNGTDDSWMNLFGLGSGRRVIKENKDYYRSTVLAHAIAPRKSFFALCDFLEKFYKNNLDCSFYFGDPAIRRMTEVLRGRCQDATIEQDKEIQGNVSGIQIGLKSLLIQRPIYMYSFLTSVLQSMDTLLSGGELRCKDYTDVLLTQWYADKLSASSEKRSGSKHKRTTEIAFSYEKIRLSFILDENSEPALRIPSIRLASRENPTIIIYDGDTGIYRQSIGIYGNDYAVTSEELILPFSDLRNIHSNDIRIEMMVGNEKVFISDKNFWTGTLLFKDGKLISCKTVDEGNYVLFVSKTSTVKFDGDIERQRRSYFAQLYDFYMQGEASVYIDGALLCCFRPPFGSLQFKLPKSDADYIIDGIRYSIYARKNLSITAVGTLRDTDFVAETDEGTALYIKSDIDGEFQIEPPVNNGRYTIMLIDSKTKHILDEKNIFIVNHFDVTFDKPYYLENAEDGTLTISIDDKFMNIPLSGHKSKGMIPYDKAELFVQIPQIRLLLDGNSLPGHPVWKGDISPASQLRVICPSTVDASLMLGGTSIGRTKISNGFEYAIGNAIQAYDGDKTKLSVDLSVAGNIHHMFYVMCKPCLMDEPQFSLHGNTLLWLNPHSFVGSKETKLRFAFQPQNGRAIKFIVAQCESVLFRDFPEKSERYNVVVSAVMETAFGENNVSLYEGTVIFGNKYEVIFRGEILKITRVIEDGEYTVIKPVFIDNIRFINQENLDFTDLSGEYAHYTGNLYFKTRNGIRYFTDFNPVDIYLVNDTAGRLYISFNEREGLFVDIRDEKELYKHIDPPKHLAKYFFMPDFFEYEIDKEMH